MTMTPLEMLATISASGTGRSEKSPLPGIIVAIKVKPGDTVLYGKYAGTEIELDGEKYLIMRQSDILAIL